MTTTVIGVYDEFQPAFSAKNELLATGFSWTQVQLNPDHEVPLRERSATPHTDPNSVSFNIGTMFSGLFGSDNTTHSNVYAEAVRRGGYVVTVDVETDEERARADEIVHRFGPVNLEERSSDWLRRGWRGHDPGSRSGK
jgi:hypothetical protein